MFISFELFPISEKIHNLLIISSLHPTNLFLSQKYRYSIYSSINLN